METKILKAVFGGGTSTVTNKRTRTDYGQVLEISGVDLPETFECIFSNSNTSAGVGKKMIGSSQRVLIPDEYLATGQPIYAWILLHDTEDDGRHMYSIRIPVADMPDTSPEEPTPVEQSIISQAITALNSAVTTTTQKAQEATESADRAEQAAEGAEGYAERAESAQQAAESARDRAEEAKVSAQASAATASEKASEAISSATTASQSAMSAESASESAQASADASYQNAQTAYRYAQDSATSAGQAGSYASGAGIYASDAQTYSQTASQKALEATQSASTAVQAKTDAETAKTASETAQGLAESARDNAITAKTYAEDARDEAQEIVDSITNKIEQIDSNTERIESLEDDRYKPYPTDTASGSVASFPDGAGDIPLKSCIVQIEPVQEGSGDQSPDNVRPITGWTGCEVGNNQKNIFDESVFDGVDGITLGQDGFYEGKVSAFTKAFSSLLPAKGKYIGNTIYAISCKYYFSEVGTFTGNACRFTVAYTDGISGNVLSLSATQQASYYASSAIGYIDKSIKGLALVLSDYRTSNYILHIKDVQIEVGSTATDYVPYQGQTYPITFPSEAGTVYGGYVDVINGELVVDRAIVDLGTKNWGKRSLTDRSVFYCYLVSENPRVYSSISENMTELCSNYPFGAKHNGPSNLAAAVPNKSWGRTFDGSTFFVIRDDDYADATAFKEAMSGVQLVYELAEPIHYPLTSTEIKTLLGTNNIWADTGDTEVEYRADTKLYIEKLTQPEEYDMIADSAINSGQFFMVGNSLYQALANIVSGATITVGTNAQRVSLSDALNLVNT